MRGPGECPSPPGSALLQAPYARAQAARQGWKMEDERERESDHA